MYVRAGRLFPWAKNVNPNKKNAMNSVDATRVTDVCLPEPPATYLLPDISALLFLLGTTD